MLWFYKHIVHIPILHIIFLSVPLSILTDAKSVSLNATAAFKAYSNIKANVDAAEKEAKAAKQSASEALDLVGGPSNPFPKLIMPHGCISQDATHVAFRRAVSIVNTRHHLFQPRKCEVNTPCSGSCWCVLHAATEFQA